MQQLSRLGGWVGTACSPTVLEETTARGQARPASLQLLPAWGCLTKDHRSQGLKQQKSYNFIKQCHPNKFN